MSFPINNKLDPKEQYLNDVEDTKLSVMKNNGFAMFELSKMDVDKFNKKYNLNPYDKGYLYLDKQHQPRQWSGKNPTNRVSQHPMQENSWQTKSQNLDQQPQSQDNTFIKQPLIQTELSNKDFNSLRSGQMKDIMNNNPLLQNIEYQIQQPPNNYNKSQLPIVNEINNYSNDTRAAVRDNTIVQFQPTTPPDTFFDPKYINNFETFLRSSGIKIPLQKEVEVFSHYLDRSGETKEINPYIWPEIAQIARERVGENYKNGTKIVIDDNNYYRHPVSFYERKPYDKILGTSTVYFDEDGNPIGLDDLYDFDPKPDGVRSEDAEDLTQLIYDTQPIHNGLDFKINYGAIPIPDPFTIDEFIKNERK